ncbi:hypothetical protein PHYBOEH_010482 [Phytophthora boehmeriae]|uniref:RxLR effector protein n=1 Tax=Phytophthora boehmeriae TaxID=109152 RepID=A0A8T1VQ97_9STRA|nr:hypothetical protein PHYBOEH_010482 [Phytophthora boehmeriae]
MRAYYVLLMTAAALLVGSHPSLAATASDQSNLAKAAAGVNDESENRFLRAHKTVDDDDEYGNEIADYEKEERSKLPKFTALEKSQLSNQKTMYETFPKWLGMYSPSDIWTRLRLDKAKNAKYRDIYDRFVVYRKDMGH